MGVGLGLSTRDESHEAACSDALSAQTARVRVTRAWGSLCDVLADLLLQITLAVLRRVHRLFSNGLCEPSVRIDPPDSIFLGSESRDKVYGAIGPRYPHAPNAALLHC